MSGARNRRARKREQLLEQLRELAARVGEASITPRWPLDVRARDRPAALELADRYGAAIDRALHKGCSVRDVARAAELPLSTVKRRAA